MMDRRPSGTHPPDPSPGGTPSPRPGGGDPLEHVALWGTVTILAVLILYPLALLLLRSLQTEELTGFTLDNYTEILGDRRLVRAMGNSLIVSAGTAVLATLLGVSLAWINARTNTPGGRILGHLNLLPFFTSPFVGAIAWTILAAKNSGLINQWAARWFGAAGPVVNIYTPLGIIWVLALFDTPVVYLFALGAFRKMDPSLEESARVAGSGLLGTTVRVTLPLALPSILAAATLIFVTAMGAFEVPLALGIPARYTVITTELFGLINEVPVRYNLATALCAPLLLITGFGLAVQRRIFLRRDYITVTGKGYRPSPIDIGRGRYVALAWNALYLLVAVVLPMLGLLAASLQRVWTGSMRRALLSLGNYDYVLFRYGVARRAILNSLILAGAGATLGMALGTIAAYLVFRSRLRGRGVLDLLAALPVAVPGAILAVGVVVGWIRTSLYGTLTIILIAYIARFIPYAQRSVGALLLSISPELDECSRISGATWWSTMRNVMLPLLKPGIIAGWILLFIIFIRELSMSLFLYRIGTETMSVAVFLLMTERPTATAAFAIIQTAIILLAVMVFRRVSREGDIVL